MRRPKRAISDPHPQTISHLRCDDLLQHIASECFRNVVPPSGPPDHATALISAMPPCRHLLARPIIGTVWVWILKETRQQRFRYCRSQKVRAYPPLCSYSAVVRVGDPAPYFAATTSRTVIRSAVPRKSCTLWDVILRREVSELIPRRFIWHAS